jgi:hypothetical protein
METSDKSCNPANRRLDTWEKLANLMSSWRTGRESLAKNSFRGSEIVAEFPDLQKTSRGDSKDVLEQKQG